jgi:transcriptional regulator with XRE-family HTH domain
MNPKSVFGARVKALRTAKGWSQERLAAEAKLDRTYVGGIKHGERNPSIINIRRLAKALNVAVPRLVSEVSVRLWTSLHGTKHGGELWLGTSIPVPAKRTNV